MLYLEILLEGFTYEQHSDKKLNVGCNPTLILVHYRRGCTKWYCPKTEHKINEEYANNELFSTRRSGQRPYSLQPSCAHSRVS